MNERVLVHAIWASCLMYCVAIVGMAIVYSGRPTAESVEAMTGKMIAIFGPLVTLLTAILFRGGSNRNNGSNEVRK